MNDTVGYSDYDRGFLQEEEPAHFMLDDIDAETELQEVIR